MRAILHIHTHPQSCSHAHTHTHACRIAVTHTHTYTHTHLWRDITHTYTPRCSAHKSAGMISLLAHLYLWNVSLTHLPPYYLPPELNFQIITDSRNTCKSSISGGRLFQKMLPAPVKRGSFHMVAILHQLQIPVFSEQVCKHIDHLCLCKLIIYHVVSHFEGTHLLSP